MKRIHYLLAGAALAGGLAIAAVQAQTPVPPDQSGPFAQYVQWNGPGRDNAEERMQRADRRLADMKSRLQLTADQEKLWPPVEAAMRDMQKTTSDLRDQMRTAMQADGNSTGQMPDPAARLRNMAAMSTARANGLQKIADAIDPLYKTFDDNQKRRFADMSRFGGMGGDGRDGFQGRGRDDDRGYGRRWRDRDEQRGYGRRWREDDRGEWRGRGRDDERDFGRRWRDRDDERGYERRRWRDEDRGSDRRRDWQ